MAEVEQIAVYSQVDGIEARSTKIFDCSAPGRDRLHHADQLEHRPGAGPGAGRDKPRADRARAGQAGEHQPGDECRRPRAGVAGGGGSGRVHDRRGGRNAGPAGGFLTRRGAKSCHFAKFGQAFGKMECRRKVTELAVFAARTPAILPKSHVRKGEESFVPLPVVARGSISPIYQRASLGHRATPWSGPVSRQAWNGVGLSPVRVIGPCERAAANHPACPRA